jgi:hypothetical protein
VKGRLRIVPRVYLRAVLDGYCDDISRKRGVAWRLADSLSPREFVGFNVGDQTPDHSTLSPAQRLLPVEPGPAVFRRFAWAQGAKGFAERAGAGRRRHDAESECRDEIDCAARHGR